MNRLPLNKRIDVIAALVEGNSLRAIVRMTGVALNTVTKLLVDMGCACAAYHHGHVRNVRVRRLQCDEIWQFIGAKKKNVTPEQEQWGWGDSWTWTAIDADTKLCVSYYVGDRGNKHVLRGAPEPHDAHVHAALHAVNEWLQQKVGESRPHGRAVFSALQLLPFTFHAARHASNGIRNQRPCLER